MALVRLERLLRCGPDAKVGSTAGCADKGKARPGRSGPSSLSSVAHFDLKSPPPNSPSQELSLNPPAEHPAWQNAPHAPRPRASVLTTDWLWERGNILN